MKYAVISDIHGNMPAFEAVLEDAKSAGVNRFILTGDYYLCLPFPNEVVNKIKSLKNAYAVCGNEERNIAGLAKQDKSAWTDGQFCASYWCFDEMTEETKNYLLNLPEELEICDSSVMIRAFHSSKTYFNNTKLDELTSAQCALDYKEKPFTRQRYIKMVHSILNDDPMLKVALDAIPDGIYIFGHTHIQWNIQIGNKLLLNPGSCGLPLDCAPNAPYTIIEIIDGKCEVEERRIKYDLDATIEYLKSSELYSRAKVWSDIIISELRTSSEHVQFFLKHVEKFATEINDSLRPYSHETWKKAYEMWEGK